MGEGDGGRELKEGVLSWFEKGGEEEMLCEGRNMSIDIMPGVYFSVSS
jgi:hypothetical protein